MDDIKALVLRRDNAIRAQYKIDRQIVKLFQDKTGLKWGQRVAYTNDLGDRYTGTVLWTEFDRSGQFNANVLFDYTGSKTIMPLGIVKFYKADEERNLCLLNQS